MTDSRTYIRLHDGMADHPKIDGLSDGAFRLLVSMWCWCSRHLTDGHVPAATWVKRGTPKARAELVESGMAILTDTGVFMHDYLEHQRSADEVRELKEKRRESGSKGGRTTRAKRVASATANEQQVLQQTSSKSAPSTDTDTEEVQLLASDEPEAGKRRRPPDPLWDAVMVACHVDISAIPKQARGAYNAAVGQLRDVNATPGQITLRARKFTQIWPEASLTPTALARRWPELNGTPTQARRFEQ